MCHKVQQFHCSSIFQLFSILSERSTGNGECQYILYVYTQLYRLIFHKQTIASHVHLCFPMMIWNMITNNSPTFSTKKNKIDHITTFWNFQRVYIHIWGVTMTVRTANYTCDVQSTVDAPLIHCLTPSHQWTWDSSARFMLGVNDILDGWNKTCVGLRGDYVGLDMHQFAVGAPLLYGLAGGMITMQWKRKIFLCFLFHFFFPKKNNDFIIIQKHIEPIMHHYYSGHKSCPFSFELKLYHRVCVKVILQ